MDDGLPDHWKSLPAGNVDVALHIGTEIQLFPPAGEPVGAVTTPATPTPLKLGNDGFITATDSNDVVINPYGQQILWGNTKGRNRIADVDGDGRVDLITWTSVVATPTVYFNVGGQLQASGPPYPGNPVGVQRQTLAKNPSGVEQMTWQLNADLLDLDGDGLDEGVFYEAGAFKRAKPAAAQPPRLLSVVRNGRGAQTTITYAHMNDRSLPRVVEQNPDEKWWDLRPKASPRAQWVVKSMTTSDTFQGGTATTSYVYKNPRFAADDHGHYGFRGFEEVTTTHPGPSGIADGTGKKTIHRYGYDVDWSGRLVTTLVKPATAEGANDVRTIDTTTWQVRSLFGGALTTYHPLSQKASTLEFPYGVRNPGGTSSSRRAGRQLAGPTVAGRIPARIECGRRTGACREAGVAPAPPPSSSDGPTPNVVSFWSQPRFRRMCFRVRAGEAPVQSIPNGFEASRPATRVPGHLRAATRTPSA